MESCISGHYPSSSLQIKANHKVFKTRSVPNIGPNSKANSCRVRPISYSKIPVFSCRAQLSSCFPYGLAWGTILSLKHCALIFLLNSGLWTDSKDWIVLNVIFHWNLTVAYWTLFMSQGQNLWQLLSVLSQIQVTDYRVDKSFFFIFSTASRHPLVPTQPPMHGVPGSLLRNNSYCDIKLNCVSCRG